MALIASKNGFLVDKRFPYDAEVEYLESTGKQWIDTGFRSDNTCKISIGMEIPASMTTNGWVFGSRNGSSSANDKSCLFAAVNENTCYAMLGSGIKEFNLSLIKNNLHIVEMSLTGGVVIDGAVVARFTPSEQADVFTNIFPIVLFTLRFGPSTLGNNFHGRIYGFSVMSNGIPRLLFQPVRFTNENGQSEGAMYDRVSGKLFGNKGTDDFVLGPDK